jgi:hypothetical protein
MIVFLLLLKKIKVSLFVNLQNKIKDYFSILKRSIEYNIQMIWVKIIIIPTFPKILKKITK